MITKIMSSNMFQKIIIKTKDKRFLEKMNRNLPIYESAFATTLYFVSNELNKDIPKERKASLNWQTAIGGITGISLSKIIDSWANKHKDSICKELGKLNINNSKKIIAGTRIVVPLVITSFCTRYLTSTLSVPISIFLSHIGRNLKKENKNVKSV